MFKQVISFLACFGCLLILCLVTVSSLNFVSTDGYEIEKNFQSQKTTNTPVDKVIKKDGWDLSFLKRFKEDKATTLESNETIDGINFHTTLVHNHKSFVYKFEKYFLKTEGTLEAVEVPCSPYDFVSYKISKSEKIFAY